MDDKRLSEDRLAKALCAMNTEIKTVTLLHLLKEAPQSASDLQRAMRKSIGNIDQIPDVNSIKEACEDAFLKRGIVEKTTLWSKSPAKFGYQLTPEGERIFVPQAAFCLDSVVMSGESMYTTFGFNSSKGKTNAPGNRFKLIETIACYDSISESELAILTNMELTPLINNLHALEKLGYISFESLGKNGERKESFNVKFKKNKAQLPKVKAVTPEVVANTYSALERYGTSNRDNLADAVAKHPSTVYRIIRGLISSGHAVHAEDSWGDKKSSIIKPLKKLNDFAVAQAIPLRDASQEGPWLIRMREQYLEPLRNYPALLAEWGKKALLIYSLASPHINKMRPEERMDQIEALIRARKDSTLRDIADALNTSTSTALRYATHLQKLGKISKSKDLDNQNIYNSANRS